MKNLLRFVTFILFGIFSTPLYSLSSDWALDEKSKIRLISPFTTSNNSNEIILALEYQLEPDWKTYWKSPGGGGFPQKLLWNNSENIKQIEIEWPKPIEFEILGLPSIGYKDNVLFPLLIEVEDPNKTTSINLNINYLVCKHICIPGNANLYLEIPPGDGEYTSFFYDIEKARSTTSIKNFNFTDISTFEVNAEENNENVFINVKVTTESFFDNPKIYIHTPFGLPVVNPSVNYSLDYKTLKTSYKFDKNQFSESEFPIEVSFFDNNINYIHQENVIINNKNNNNNFIINNSLVYLLFISLVGGLILNFMPCVFPVLSIKLLSILNTESKKIKLSFLITSIGIIISFLLLALFFAFLKYINVSISWGMQFQEPYFIIFILIVISLFFINTIGIFHINIPSFLLSSRILNSGNNFYTKNFFNGFFATLLATPCSAPYIGTAVAAAFTQSISYLFLIFLFMGIGMRSPYILITLFPSLVKRLPRPGKWTIYFKYFLSLLLLLTILWLLNILLAYFNYLFLLSFLFIFIFITISLRLKFYNVLIVPFLIISFFVSSSIDIFKNNNQVESNDKWINFDKTEINSLIQNDEIVFLDITADWCITCQFNKKNVINSKKILNLFNDNNVILVRGDWTLPNNKIGNFLKEYNKFGIPFNALYSKKFPNGIIMSELLTQKEIIESFGKINQ